MGCGGSGKVDLDKTTSDAVGPWVVNCPGCDDCRCSKCGMKLLYFPDGVIVCGNKKCKMYAPKTYSGFPDSTTELGGGRCE